jgi:hypothetical protein
LSEGTVNTWADRFGFVVEHKKNYRTELRLKLVPGDSYRWADIFDGLYQKISKFLRAEVGVKLNQISYDYGIREDILEALLQRSSVVYCGAASLFVGAGLAPLLFQQPTLRRAIRSRRSLRKRRSNKVSQKHGSEDPPLQKKDIAKWNGPGKLGRGKPRPYNEDENRTERLLFLKRIKKNARTLEGVRAWLLYFCLFSYFCLSLRIAC